MLSVQLKCGLVAWLLMACSFTAEAGGRLPVALDLAQYHSPSGQFTLTVDPSERHGAGPANYELRRGDERVWSGELPFTLRQAVVDDAGRVGGYGYSNGAAIQYKPGDFLVAILTPTGEAAALHRAPREQSRFIHVDADPKAAGLFLHPDLGRLVVRVVDPDVNRGRESWWLYALDDGSQLATWQPDPGGALDQGRLWVLDARALPGTPLTLVRWARNTSDSVVALLNEAGQPVWAQELPGDLADARFGSERMRLLSDQGLLVDSARPGWFEVWQLASAWKVEFLAVADGSSSAPSGPWHVAETARSVNFEQARAPAVAPDDLVAEKLHHLGSIVLRPELEQDETAVPLGQIQHFAPDPHGGLGILHGDPCETPETLSISLVDADGDVRLEGELRLAGLACRSQLSLTSTMDGNWLLAVSDFEASSRPQIWRINGTDATASRLVTLWPGTVSALAALPDGGFVLLYRAGEGSEQEAGLLAFDAGGRMRWRLGHALGVDQAIFSPEDLAVVATGEIAVLENPGQRIRFFNLEGHFQRSVTLEDSWQRAANYPTNIAATPDGGLMVFDFGGKPSVVPLDTLGAVDAGYIPRHVQGDAIDPIHDLAVDALARVWVSDGYAVLGLDASGRVERAYGSPPASIRLTAPSTFALGVDGRSFVVDYRTGFVHVFEPDGSAACIAQPDPALDEAQASIPSLSVNGQGELLLGRSRGATDTDFWVRFGRDCNRRGQVRIQLDDARDWLIEPGGSRGWVVGHATLARVGADAEVLVEVQRDSEGRWLDNLGAGDVAPDGSLAVITGPDFMASERVVRINLFAADGKPLRTWDAPDRIATWSGMLAWDGERVAVAWQASPGKDPTLVLLTDAQGRETRLLEPLPGRAISDLGLRRVEQGTELWIFDGKRNIERYAVP